ncbi:unnamed protein product [Ambrosiozyma monospora]|uniref:Unnamed protein product n=1 Tax=Ambrosiozyma monospora TaxID=43982 RepID=A0A9W7DJF2_AMBMO|nr:unnamed protein product [Ambrosiozyma monospora]
MKISSTHFSPLLVTFVWIGIISYHSTEANSFGLPTMTPEPTTTILPLAHSNTRPSDAFIIDQRDTMSATNISNHTTAASSTFLMTDTIALHWASLAALERMLYLLLSAGEFSSLTSSLGAAQVGVSFLMNSSFSTSVSNLYMSLLSAAPNSYHSEFQTSLTNSYFEFVKIGSSAASASLNSSYSLSSQLGMDPEFVQYSICEDVFSDMKTFNPYQYVLLIQSSSDDTSSKWLKDLVTAFSDFQNTNVDHSSVCNILNKAEFLAQSYMMVYLQPSPYLIVNTSTILPYDTNAVTVTDAGSSAVLADYFPFFVSYTITSRLVASYGIGIYTFVSTSWTHSVTTVSHNTTIFQGDTGSNVLHPIRTVTPNITRLVNCGVTALVYDYYSGIPPFEEFISSNLNETYVNRYINLIESFTSSNIDKNPKDYQRVYAGFYNFIFESPLDRLVQLLDYMGYCYMEYETNTESFSMTRYTTGALGADVFTQIFSFGDMSGFISFGTTTASNGSTSVWTDYMFDFRRTGFVFPLYIDDGLETPDDMYMIATTYTISNADVTTPKA